MASIKEDSGRLMVDVGDVTKANRKILKFLNDIEVHVLLKCKSCGKHFEDVMSFLNHISTEQCKSVHPQVETKVNKPVIQDPCRAADDLLLSKTDKSLQEEASEDEVTTISVSAHRFTSDKSPDSLSIKPRENMCSKPTIDRPSRRRCSIPKYLGDYVTSNTQMVDVKKEAENEKIEQVLTPVRTGQKRKAPPTSCVEMEENLDSVEKKSDASENKSDTTGTCIIIKRGRGRPRKNIQNSGVSTVFAANSGNSKTSNENSLTEGTDSVVGEKENTTCSSIATSGGAKTLFSPVHVRRGPGRPRKDKSSGDFENYDSKERKAREEISSSPKKRLCSQNADVEVSVENSSPTSSSILPSTDVPQTMARSQSGQENTQKTGTEQEEMVETPNLCSNGPSMEVNSEKPPEILLNQPEQASMGRNSGDQVLETKVCANEQEYVIDPDNRVVHKSGNVCIENFEVEVKNEIDEENFKCNICENQSYATAYELAFHLECHSKKGFYCVSCGYSSPHWDHILEHMLEHKPLKNRLKDTELGKKYIGEFVCPLCPQKFDLRHRLRAHINRDHNQQSRSVENKQAVVSTKKKKKAKLIKGDIGEFYKCPRCKRRYFSSIEEMTFHLNFHIEGEVEKYKCTYSDCNYESSQWDRMLEHMVVHPDLITILEGTKLSYQKFTATQCKICKKKFRAKSLMKSHLSKVHNKRDFECSVCGKTLEKIDIKSFRRHVEKCSNKYNGIKLSCEHCSYQTFVSKNLDMHKRIHDGRGFTCEKCGRMFALKFQLLQHQRVHIENRETYMCEYCAQNFLSAKSLEAHVVRMHEDAHTVYKCPYCKFVSKLEADITRHLKCVHDGKFKCLKCPYSTNMESSLKQHEVYHQEDRIFPCSYPNCYYRGRTAKQLCDHRSAVHNSKKIFRCKICSKTYKKLTHLKRHMVLHTGEHPYACYYCGERFQCHARYYRHLREHKAKGDTPDEQFQMEPKGMCSTTEEMKLEIPQLQSAEEIYYMDSAAEIHHENVITLNNHRTEEEELSQNLIVEEGSNVSLQNAEAAPVYTYSEEYIAVKALSDHLYQSAGSQDGASGQASVSAEEVVMTSEEVNLLTQDRVHQQLLMEDSEVNVVEMREPSQEEYTVILNTQLAEEGSVIEFPVAHQTTEGVLHVGHSQIVEVSAPSTGENEKPQYAILMLDGTENE